MAIDTEAPRWTGWRPVRHFAYVDRAFSQVRSYLAAAPSRLLGDNLAADGERGGQLTDLHLQRAGVDVSRNVRVLLGDIEIAPRCIRIPLHWEDARRPGLFPVLAATLEIAPVASGPRPTTQLLLAGRYGPPLGRLGALADTVAGHRVVLESVERFLDGLTDRLERDLPKPAPVPEAAEAPHARSPGRLHRVVLPFEGLGDRAGGAMEIQQRLLAVEGVETVDVDPLVEMAVVGYDATVCGLSGLLTALHGEET